MCFLPTDTDTEGSQLPLTASYITPYPELNVEEADLFYQEGTPEVPFQTNQEWYATFTGEDGSRYAVHAGGRGHPCPEVLSGRRRELHEPCQYCLLCTAGGHGLTDAHTNTGGMHHETDQKDHHPPLQ